MNKSLIELHVPDFEIVKTFYHVLGFRVVWERSPNAAKGYLVLSLEDNVLCFWGGNDRIYEHRYFKKFPAQTAVGFGVEIVIQVKDVRSLYAALADKVEIYQSLKLRPWGLEDFRIVDPFGFYLRFTQVHDITDSNFAVP